MKILFLGDVMGRAGRKAISDLLPDLRQRWSLDFIVVNGENATNGMGLSADHARLILDAGADVVTLGDHAFDQKDMLTLIEKEPRILRPLNFSKNAPGAGARVFEATRGRKVLVTQVLGQVFMKRPNSVIGMEKTEPLRRFITGMPKERFTPAAAEATLSGLYVETDDMTGKATRVEMVRQGGRLAPAGPA